MSKQYKKEVLATYQRKKQGGYLSEHLLNPTTANLRNECIVAFSKRPTEMIKNIFQSFSKVAIEIAQDIEAIDPDKFRPLQNYIRGGIDNPNIHTVELLAWLIDFNPDDIENGYWKKVLNKIKEIIKKNKAISVMVILMILSLVVYLIITRKRCMYWTGNNYEATGCDVIIGDTPIIHINKYNLEHLKRITKPDTLTLKDVGKVWYTKINVDSAEFYTDSGSYPLDTLKRLRPMTQYILDKYVQHK